MAKISWKCSGHGCPYKTSYFKCIKKHGNRCIKKMKWLVRQGFMTEEMLKVNIKYIKKMGYEQL